MAFRKLMLSIAALMSMATFLGPVVTTHAGPPPPKPGASQPVTSPKPIKGQMQLGKVASPIPMKRVGTITDGKDRLYKVGVSQMFRGDEALVRIRKTTPNAPLPANNKEYMMVFFVVRYFSGPAGKDIKFLALSNDHLVTDVPNVQRPRPAFLVDRELEAIQGGWVVFEVDMDDPAPLVAVLLHGQTNDEAVYFSL